MSYQIVIFDVGFLGCDNSIMAIWECALPCRKYLGRYLSMKNLGIKCHDICTLLSNESERKSIGRKQMW